MKQNKINKEMPYYLYINNIYLYQYHDTKSNPINIDWLLGLLIPTQNWQEIADCGGFYVNSKGLLVRRIKRQDMITLSYPI